MNGTGKARPPLRCRACGGDHLRLLARVRGQRTGEAIPLARCRRCGHYSAFPTVYRGVKSFAWDGIPVYLRNLASARRHSLLTIAYLLKLSGRPPEKTRLLDVGCGLGAALMSARDLGIDAVGIDPEVKITDYGRAHYGLKIVTGTLEDHPFGGTSFDVVFLEQVLEHIDSPGRFLQLALTLTAPEGFIYVGVPPVNFLNKAVTRVLIRGLGMTRLSNPQLDIFFDPEEHVNGFTGTSMAWLAARAGLELTCLNTREFLELRQPVLSAREKANYRLRAALGPCGQGRFILRRPAARPRAVI